MVFPNLSPCHNRHKAFLFFAKPHIYDYHFTLFISVQYFFSKKAVAPTGNNVQ